MAFVQQWSEDGDIAAGESYSFPISPSPTAGNLFVAILAIDKEGKTNLAASGFAKHATYGGTSGGTPTCAVFSKSAGGSETSIEFTWTGSDDLHAWAGEYSGQETSSPVDVQNDAETASSVTQIPDGSDIEITTTVAKVLLFATANWDSKLNADQGTLSWTGTDVSERFAGYTGAQGEPQIYVGDGAKTATDTFGTRGNTSDTGDQACIWFGAFKDAAAGANPKGPLGMPFHGPFGGPV